MTHTKYGTRIFAVAVAVLALNASPVLAQHRHAVGETRTYTLRAASGMNITGNAGAISPNAVKCNFPSEDAKYQSAFLVTRVSPDEWAFRTMGGYFLSADGGGMAGLSLRSRTLGPNERFKLSLVRATPNGFIVGIGTPGGTFLSCPGTGQVFSASPQRGSDETFAMELLDGLTAQTVQGQYQEDLEVRRKASQAARDLIVQNRQEARAEAAKCQPRTFREDSRNTWVEFRLPKRDQGDRITVPGGSYYKYSFPLCGRVVWDDLTFSCGLSGWERVRGSWSSDALCNLNNVPNSEYIVTGDK